ncbi:Acetyltransferase (GNAT) domain-containing protein [Geodermatophilus amargosae]|uniref:Acetyltransferase (GNAT) domain-containing protein n=1 Tax=Geodermatophilus amargosae TaxID=1296565 RepID=A0A1I6YT36_9ACTN|nr:Acetyltransferase (GNAT) domain-containing protein [Geodermatophilus amargosae]
MAVVGRNGRWGTAPRRVPSRITLDHCRSGGQWDRLIERTAGSTAFHAWDWLELQAQAHGWRFEPLLASVDGEAVGVAPLLLGRRHLSMEARVPFPYVGPVVPPEHLTGTLLALDGWARENRIVSSRAEFAPGVSYPAEAAPRARWDVHEDLTWVVDLSHGSVDQFWRGTRRSVRRTLRSAEQRGVVVRPSTKTEVCQWLPPFFDEAYGARGLPSPYPRDVGEAIWERYGEREGVCMLSAWVGDQPGGLSLAFGHGETLYSWAGGGFRSRRGDNTGTALYVHEILWALEHGFRFLDEVGAVDEGVSRFKRAFGAQEVPYLVATRTHSPVWRQVRRAYRLAKRGRERLSASPYDAAGRAEHAPPRGR